MPAVCVLLNHDRPLITRLTTIFVSWAAVSATVSATVSWAAISAAVGTAVSWAAVSAATSEAVSAATGVLIASGLAGLARVGAGVASADAGFAGILTAG